ncbi:hypothetical protein Clacol_009074 [Clathrus columnatus]|uniref:Fe-containing alcohol dehydrogenase-like C-terminal domain-containing protein n=1 Tax=Clathrus columnatus TaxID=1419009 RepID=A0AAV5AJI6_9AGAM|nr:hypothetical protein Clacol_009074 [Clathrus columnatus]
MTALEIYTLGVDTRLQQFPDTPDNFISAESIVVIGSGSYTDAAKVAMIAHATFNPSDKLELSDIESLALKSKTKPTTIKSKEPRDLQKQLFSHPKCAAKCVILDPELCTTTPMRLWLGSGIRAVDHCIEALCSEKCTSEIGLVAEQGLRNLLIGLLASHEDSQNVLAKGQSQIGAWQAMRAIHEKVELGASHAIGHQLGGVANVAHDGTSCVLLPSVLKYNKTVNVELQKRVANILWESSSSILEEAGLNQDTDTGDLLKAFMKALGLPTSLREVGVGEDLYDDIAIHSLSDALAPTNPRPLRNIEQVKEILKMSA